ncbi:DNA polymerase delta catalytic subunit [Chrysoperla carnea]|uniref:DNA polymerase delta catalytic subunit n=1 Tax=Chrysoperla carnea TaxID=189513 RepID=UPI001D097318|nr:DNA polymerase delta catalytic subunit [Chrysoperla carnea]
MSKRNSNLSPNSSPKKIRRSDAYNRSPVPALKPEKDKFIFQQIDVEHYNSQYLPGMPGPQSGGVAVIRMFGITMDGHSVLCHVHGFLHYFYVVVPNAFDETHIKPFKEALNTVMMQDMKNNSDGVKECVQDVKLVEKLNLQGYVGDTKQKFAQIFVTLPKMVAAGARLLREAKVYDKFGYHDYQPFESNVDFDIRFMVDKHVKGCCWIELPSGTWRHRPSPLSPGVHKESRCNFEVDVSCNDLIAHAPEGEWSKVAPFYFLSFDIECDNRKGIFPEPEHDAVIQIANVVQRHGDAQPIYCNVYTLKSCAPIAHAEVFSFEKEGDMLNAWAEFVRKLDPDVVTGYNINNFDLPYLTNRAKTLKLDKFPFLGRLKNVVSVVREKVTQSKLLGRREYKYVNMEGRLPYDMLIVARRNCRLRSYTLNNVAQELLGQQKEDVHHTQISDLFNGDEQTRHRLAVYCIKDAQLPLRILNHLNSFTNDMELARVSGVTINLLMTRGEQIKVVTQLLSQAQAAGYLMPVYKGQGTDDQFEGATVIEPVRGYYTDPIATLDFNSLYPSIMMAHNLCYTTLLHPSNKDKFGLTEDQITKTPSNHFFVKPTVRRGLLPYILENLLAARKKAKKELEAETDPVKKSVLNGRQLALKLSANSVYGFTGAQNGKLPCLEISGSVTAFGRTMIERTRQEVEEKYTMANGYEHNAQVIYGDTDSVMVKFGVKDLERCMELGREAAAYVSAKFINPIRLEFEKVYYPYLLINKKRYAGLYYTKPDKYDKMDCKGIETVRRDNSPLVANTINLCLQKLLIQKDPEGAIEHTKQVISDLLCNRIDISQLIISKELTKNEYTAKQAHVELAKKMKQRDAGTAPQLGDRVPFVIISATKNTRAYDKAEDPIYVLENNIPIDVDYYLQNQLAKPLVRIFQPVLGDKAESILLRGEHTRSRNKATSKVGALFSFTKKREVCLGCRTVLPVEYETEALCQHCLPEKHIYLQNELCKQRQLEENFSRLWTECQRCQGSLHEEVLCSSRDCPIFYMRKKVSIDLQSSAKRIERFGDPSW